MPAGCLWYQDRVPRSSAVALVALVAFGVFVLVGGAVGAVVLGVGGVALLVASGLSRREPHGRYTRGIGSYPYWMWTWGSAAVGVLWIALAAAQLLQRE